MIDATLQPDAPEAADKFAAVIQFSDPAVIGKTPEGIITDWSPSAEKMFGYAAPEVLGKPVMLLIPPDREEHEGRILARVARGEGVAEFETVRIKKDGTPISVGVSIIPVRDRAGRVVGISKIARDLTERKLLEEENKKLELRLLRAQRMESVGRLASGIAHDMNNILAPIIMCVPLLRGGAMAGEADRFLGIIETSAKRGAHLVKQLLFFGQGAEGVRSVMRLKDSIQEIEDIIGQTFPKRIALVSEVSLQAWPICADPTQIHQVLLNLCVNARDAMPQGGRLTLAVENIHVGRNYAGLPADVKPGPYVRLAVTDTGTGISTENIGRIFDLFFTTKGVGRSSGLGLSTVLGIVKSHGGFVTLQSEPGRGSSFRVHLPAMPDSAEPPVKRSERPAPPGHDEMVLIVDDEESIRGLASEALSRHGYKVIKAEDGAVGAAAFNAHAGEIKLVLTDLDMPVVDGFSLIKLLKNMNPRIKILVSSGLQSENRVPGARHGLEKMAGVTFLNKPYAIADLLNAVHEALASCP